MEAFLDLPRKEKVKEFRRRVKEVQCRKESSQIQGYMYCAKKMGKLERLESSLEDSIYHAISPEEAIMWDEIVNQMSANGKGFYCARITTDIKK
jgi:hypothetical protein